MKDKLVLRQEVGEFLKRIDSHRDIYDLFKVLNYPKEVLFEASSKRKKSEFDLSKEESPKVKEIYSILSFGENLPVFLIESSTSSPAFIRYLTRVFAERHIRFLLIITTDYKEIVFVFPDYEKKETGSHKLKITKLVINNDEIHYTDIETLSNLFYTGEEASWRDVWKKWKETFSVERVTIDFFEDYKEIFFMLRDALNKQNISRKDSHEFTLQFLNRIMFIYFISKKGWLKYPKFMAWFWRAYLEDRNKGNSKRDSFYTVWLSQIFFNAFNNKSSEITGLPEDVKKILIDFPFLNGGLFNKTELDKLNVKITDDIFKQILEFFEKYNFTIKEDMPLESEVAVDPQMLGYVYESLASVSSKDVDIYTEIEKREDKESRKKWGIFYTPRVEVDFMCRRSLVEYLSKQLPDIPKEKFYHLVFEPLENKEKIEDYFQKEKLWNRLEDTLENLSVVDPACGSGAFLVGMLSVLTELYRIIYKHREVNLTNFQLKNRVVGRSLYGVDVMSWAIHAAELRLWLQLIIETDFKKDELRKHALLPNLNMNLRIGDSLVQEIGGINLNLRSSNISPELKKNLNDLKVEKQNYFYNAPTAKFKTKEEIIREETRIFEEIINERIELIESKIKSIKQKQLTLYGESAEDKEDEERKRAKIDELLKEKGDLKEVLKNLENPEKKPFIWDIDFAEIFGDKGGFDIVIGNPPYVRHEMISPPNRLKSEVTLEDRREYKEKLIKSVQTQFPVIKNIDGRSDYYIYFYFHGIGLLNERGIFCFITSNSWLDVDYGKELQEFLLKYAPIIAIYDNPKRSFAHADVNTIIALFGSPQINQEKPLIFAEKRENNWPCIINTARFIMFKKPFEEVLSAKNLIEIDEAKATIKRQGITELVKNVKKTDDCRIFPITQEDLLEDGWEYPEDYKNGRFKAGSYEGNKWGGKYLRAPDIFYTILEKGKGKFVRLGDIADVRFGIKTGANEFFYLDKKMQEEWKIEKEFLKPIMRSPRESKAITIDPRSLKYSVFMCNKKKTEIKNTNALKYIEWGEKAKVEIKQGTDKGKIIRGFQNISSIKNRNTWYSLPSNFGANIFIQMSFNNSFPFYYSPTKMLVDARLYEIKSKKFNLEKLCFSLNSTLSVLFMELFGRANLGEGALDFKVYEAKKILLIPIDIKSNKILLREPLSIFEECGLDYSKPIHEQEPKPIQDRKELDNIIFDTLQLTKDERKEVYLTVCELVKQRIDKAKSLSKD